MPKIIRFHETGSADVLKIEDLPLTEPGDGEVRLKVETWAVMGYLGTEPENRNSESDWCAASAVSMKDSNILCSSGYQPSLYSAGTRRDTHHG